jgi:glycogen phosphorylase
VKAIRRFTVRTVLPDNIAALGRLAGNLRWSWHRPTQQLFERLDPVLWAKSHDPVALLGSFNREQLQALAADAALVEQVQALSADLDRYLSDDRWYQTLGSEAPASIAYFSPEYGTPPNTASAPSSPSTRAGSASSPGTI